MAKTIMTSFNYDKPAPHMTADIYAVDVAGTFKAKALGSKELVATNIACPIDMPETVKLSFAEVPNVYAGTGIDPAFYAPSKRGMSLLVQLQTVAKVIDDEDSSYEVHLPISIHSVIKLPYNEMLATDLVVDYFLRSIGAFSVPSADPFGETDCEWNLEALMRGALDSFLSNAKPAP